MTISPVLQTPTMTFSCGDGCILYDGYVYCLDRRGQYLWRINTDTYAVSSLQIATGTEVAFDGLCSGGGFIWAGTSSVDPLLAPPYTAQTAYVVKINPATFTVVSQITVFDGGTGGNFFRNSIWGLTSDNVSVYAGGFSSPTTGNISIGKILIADSSVTTAAIDGSGLSKILGHQICVDDTNIYADIFNGAKFCVIDKTTLARTAISSDLHATYGYASEDIVQDTTYFYDVVEVSPGTAGVGIVRWKKSDLTTSFCSLTTTGNLDSLAMLANGTLIAGDDNITTTGITYLYKVDSSFNYVATYTITGINYTTGRLNHILIDNMYAHLLFMASDATSPCSLVKIPLTGFYPPVSAAKLYSVGMI